MSYDYRVKQLTERFDWRVKWRLGFYHFGCNRVFRIGKLCIILWRLS